MKIGITAGVAFPDKDWDYACRTAKELGLEAIEASAGGFGLKRHCNPGILIKDKDKRSNFIKTTQKYGLEISALSCWGNPLHPDKKIADEHAQDIDEALALAHAIDIKVINLFAGCPGAGEDARYPNWITCPWPSYFSDAIKWQWNKKIIPFWKEKTKAAKILGIKFGFEMHPGDAIYNPETLLLLREKLDSEEVSCNFDPSHLFWQGIDPIIVIKKLSSAIVHTHAKDSQVDRALVEFRGVNDWKPYTEVQKRAWSFRTIGYGHDMQFWKNYVSSLRLIGFDGVLSIEHEDPIIEIEEGLKKSVEFLKGILLYKKPGKLWFDA
jgi:sugar phosphate isomerase/epimerase